MSQHEYKRGDTPFHASYDQRRVERPCPICFGQKTVRVILGDETIVQTPCDFCGLGFEGARGFVMDYERNPRVERVTITSVTINDDEKREVRYSGNHYSLSSENLFDDEASALSRAEELRIEADAYDAKRSDNGNKSSRQKLSWSIGYHQCEARRERKSAEYHEARVVVLKAKEAAKASR